MPVLSLVVAVSLFVSVGTDKDVIKHIVCRENLLD